MDTTVLNRPIAPYSEVRLTREIDRVLKEAPIYAGIDIPPASKDVDLLPGIQPKPEVW